MMRRQVESVGIAPYLDAIVFSSEIGRRKPAPDLYLAALERIGVPAASTLYVGDRPREDYDGPRAVGMRAVLCTALARAPIPPAYPTIRTLAELPGQL
jgi:putative hydrolase of the HAD superfamily